MIDGQRIRKVLDRLTVDNSSGEWDANGNGHSTDTARTLDIGSKGRNGYAALKITEKIANTVNIVKNNHGTSKETHHKRSITLEYRNGTMRYRRKCSLAMIKLSGCQTQPVEGKYLMIFEKR